MPDFLFGPTPHDEAIAFLKDKPVVSRQVFNKLLPELKARAFVITGVAAADVVQSVRDRIADLPAGVPWDKIKKDLVNDLHPFLADDSDPDNRIAAERRAELLLRTHGFQAYQAAAYDVQERQKDVFPYRQYHSMGDDHVRPTHKALDGVVLPVDHEFWKTHFPPWEWGCRCQVISLSQDDHDDIAKADKKRNPDNRCILDDHALRELTTTRRLVRNGVTFNMTSPAEENKPGAFQWHPGDLHLSVDELKSRYDATTWAGFETWAKAHSLSQETKTTVWEWLNGAPVEAGTPAPVPQTTSKAVSDALKIQTTGDHRAIMRHALMMIDKVHSDGVLPEIPVNNRPGKDNLGAFWRTRGTPSEPQRIAVNPNGPWPHLTLCHEVGHFLDLAALGNGQMASETEASLHPWLNAVGKSDAAMKIFNHPTMTADRRKYWLSPRELWARSYAQFIAMKSKDPVLLSELNAARSSTQSWRQWTDQDFRPIMKAIEKLFKQKGWL